MFAMGSSVDTEREPLLKTLPYDLFISYSHQGKEEGKEVGNVVKLHLESFGYKVWIDQNIKDGMHLAAAHRESSTEGLALVRSSTDERAQEMIGQSRAVVALVSPQYGDSGACKNEFTYAVDKGKKLYLVSGYNDAAASMAHLVHALSYTTCSYTSTHTCFLRLMWAHVIGSSQIPAMRKQNGCGTL